MVSTGTNFNKLDPKNQQKSKGMSANSKKSYA